ncbi:MAG: MaoC/PaaZ C-terminal domain-containing protein [Syntrophobacteraceae bacterium]
MEILYFEDIEPGIEIAKSVTYEVSKEEIIEFARHWDPRPFHLDETAASSSVFRSLVACSAHIFSILSWFATQGDKRPASLAALGFDKVRLHHAVHPGDRLSCTFTCLEKRESKSNKDHGVVRSRWALFNQNNAAVFSAVITTLIAKRGEGD